MSNGKCKFCDVELERRETPIPTIIEGITSNCCSRVEFVCPKCGKKQEMNLYDGSAQELLLRALGLEESTTDE
jgi:hypothetical protein